MVKLEGRSAKTPRNKVSNSERRDSTQHLWEKKPGRGLVHILGNLGDVVLEGAHWLVPGPHSVRRPDTGVAALLTAEALDPGPCLTSGEEGSPATPRSHFVQTLVCEHIKRSPKAWSGLAGSLDLGPRDLLHEPHGEGVKPPAAPLWPEAQCLRNRPTDCLNLRHRAFLDPREGRGSGHTAVTLCPATRMPNASNKAACGWCPVFIRSPTLKSNT